MFHHGAHGEPRGKIQRPKLKIYPQRGRRPWARRNTKKNNLIFSFATEIAELSERTSRRIQRLSFPCKRESRFSSRDGHGGPRRKTERKEAGNQKPKIIHEGHEDARSRNRNISPRMHTDEHGKGSQPQIYFCHRGRRGSALDFRFSILTGGPLMGDPYVLLGLAPS